MPVLAATAGTRPVQLDFMEGPQPEPRRLHHRLACHPALKSLILADFHIKPDPPAAQRRAADVRTRMRDAEVRRCTGRIGTRRQARLLIEHEHQLRNLHIAAEGTRECTEGERDASKRCVRLRAAGAHRETLLIRQPREQRPGSLFRPLTLQVGVI